MPSGLEIRDGETHWWLSPDILTVPGDDPDMSNAGFPVAGQPCFVYARVKNHNTYAVVNARVNFYWANPAIGFTRVSANPIGTAFVSLDESEDDWVLCLIPWAVEFVNDGHVCLLAEAIEAGAPLPGDDFRVIADPRVAQRNIDLVQVSKQMNFLWAVPIEVFNVTHTAQAFDVVVHQGRLKELGPLLEQFDRFDGSEDGTLSELGFVDSRCPTDDDLKSSRRSTEISLKAGERAQVIVGGRTTDGVTLVHCTQRLADKKEDHAGGVSIIADAR